MKFNIILLFLTIITSTYCKSQQVAVKLDTIKIDYQEYESIVRKSLNNNDSLYNILKKTGRLEKADGTMQFYAMPCMMMPNDGRDNFIKRAKDFLIANLTTYVKGNPAEVSFTVSRIGNLENFSIKGNKKIAAVTLKFLKTEKKWSPGLCSGYPISSRYTLVLSIEKE